MFEVVGPNVFNISKDFEEGITNVMIYIVKGSDN
jgi:hypothetical protein